MFFNIWFSIPRRPGVGRRLGYLTVTLYFNCEIFPHPPSFRSFFREVLTVVYPKTPRRIQFYSRAGRGHDFQSWRHNHSIFNSLSVRLTEGFALHYTGSSQSVSAPNLLSALQNPAAVEGFAGLFVLHHFLFIAFPWLGSEEDSAWIPFNPLPVISQWEIFQWLNFPLTILVSAYATVEDAIRFTLLAQRVSSQREMLKIHSG